MPRYRVIVPAYTRVEEIHIVTAKDEYDAKQAALKGEPIQQVEDQDYYQPLKEQVTVEKIEDFQAGVAELADTDTNLSLEFDPDAPMNVTFGDQYGHAELVATPTPREIAEGQQKHPHFKLTLEGLSVSVGRSPLDGTFVIEIDGPGDEDCDDNGAPRMRLYINEENTYENPPPPGSKLEQAGLESLKLQKDCPNCAHVADHNETLCRHCGYDFHFEPE